MGAPKFEMLVQCDFEVFGHVQGGIILSFLLLNDFFLDFKFHYYKDLSN